MLDPDREHQHAFVIYLPKWSGTICEVLSAPVSPIEIVIGYVGAAATKSLLLGAIILATASLFVPPHVLHLLVMVPFPVLTSVTFLGGSFSSINMLPGIWRPQTPVNCLTSARRRMRALARG